MRRLDWAQWCWKTTLLDCLLGDKLVTSGQVSIQGLSVTSSQLDYIRGYLPQENVIVQKLKVKELIAFFLKHLPKSLEQPGNRSTIAV